MANFLMLGRTGFVPLRLSMALQKLGHSPFFVSRVPAQDSRHDVFGIPEGSSFPFQLLRQYILENKINAVINSSNKFSRSLGIEELDNAMNANFVHPARVLAIAAEAGLEKFINLASAWQLDEAKKSQHPIYTGTKNALIEYERSYESRIEVWDVFVAEIFGALDTRPKLLNLIKAAANSGEILELHSLKTKLHLTCLDRLAAHIGSLLDGNLVAPHSHLYVNYQSVPIREILQVAKEVSSRNVNIRDLGGVPEVLSLAGPVLGGEGASDLHSDLAKFFSFRAITKFPE